MKLNRDAKQGPNYRIHRYWLALSIAVDEWCQNALPYAGDAVKYHRPYAFVPSLPHVELAEDLGDENRATPLPCLSHRSPLG